MEKRTRIIKSFDGANIYYEKIAANSDKEHIVVFLHGLGGDLSDWDIEREYFYTEGISSIAIDLRGHGFSDRSEKKEFYSFDNFANDVIEVMKVEKYKKYTIVGHCFGGMITLILEANNPKSADNLVLVDTGFKPPLLIEPLKNNPILLWILEEFVKNIPNLRLLGHADFSKYIGTNDIDFRRLTSDILHVSLRSYLLISETLCGYDASQLLSKISIPTLIIEGKEDTIFPPDIAIELKKRIKRSEIDFIEGANHILVTSNPIDLAREIKRFLKKKKVSMMAEFDHEGLSKKLLDTGWQSWSYEPYGAEPLVEIPQSIYAPKRYKTFPKLHVEKKQLKKPAYGWCSWYTYGWDINEKKILQNAEWMAKNEQIPLEYVLIDAGWTDAGDWLLSYRKKFPHGLKDVVTKINALGLKAGIWIAPFMVDPWAKIAKQHPDWLIRNNGTFVDGFRLTPWDKFLPFRKWIIDMKNKEARAYLHHVISRLVEDVGVDLIKLDFLYSIYYDPELTIEETDDILRDFLHEIKVQYPRVYTIGCGCPLIPAVNEVDSMRVASDMIVSPFVKFLPLSGIFDSLYLHKRVTKSLHERIWTKYIWNMDPDAFVCRSNVGLSNKQILACQAIVEETEGNIFLGDDLTSLPEERIHKYILPLFHK